MRTHALLFDQSIESMSYEQNDENADPIMCMGTSLICLFYSFEENNVRLVFLRKACS
jgi:hypothetical protein